MKNKRIIYYSKEDMSIYWMEERIITLLENYQNINSNNIIDIIELYNLKLLIKNDCLKKLHLSDNIQLGIIQHNINSILHNFFNNLNDNNILDYYNEIDDYMYESSFWEALDVYKAYKRISIKNFEYLFNSTQFIESILQNKNIVNFYDKELSSLLKEDDKTAELIISHYAETKSTQNHKLYFPKSLSIEDKDDIISKYIDRNDCNINYIRLVTIIKGYNDFRLSDVTKLKAKKRYESEIIKIQNSDEYILYSIEYQVGFVDNQKDPKKILQNDSLYICLYSSSWIKQNCDLHNLFFNFIYLFNFLDKQGRICLTKYPLEESILDLIGLYSDSEFMESHSFKSKNNIAIATIVAYKKFLLEINIELEDVICKVFNSICSNIIHLGISLSPSNHYLEKIRYMVPEMESILKRYNSYVEYEKIDLELISISSSPCKVEDIRSSVNRKYIYPKNETNNILLELFSDQSLLKYNWDIGKNYCNFYKLICNETLNFNQLDDFMKQRFNKLISANYLYVTNDGILRITDNEEMSILNELYNKNVISYWHMPLDIQHKIDEMISNNKLYSANRLFTKSESEYFNYYLNKSFSNGKDLRNKYVHGTNNIDEIEIKNDYYQLFILFILILFKIIDDLLCKSINSKK